MMGTTRPGAGAATAARHAGIAPERRPPCGPCYVYGILPSAARTRTGLCGLGDKPARVTFIRYRRIAAAVSGVPADRSLGTPADLRAHAGVLDALARSSAVLPMRFGGVLADENAVVTELLEPHHGAFADRLDRLNGHAQFTIKGRYLGDVALREVLAERPEVMRLNKRLQGRDVWACREERIQLGELVARALELKRMADTQVLSVALAPHVAAVAERAPASAGTAVDAAFLVAGPHRRGFEDAAERQGKLWQNRIRLRLVGPVAPYDFAQPLQRGE